jgi:hypothetical protein
MKKATSKFFLFCIVFCNLSICCTSNKSPTTSTNVTDSAEKLSIAEKLKENSQLSVREQITLFYKLKKESPGKYNFRNEDELTMYGYSLLWNDEISDALEIFKLIVAEFPDSSNP